MFNKIINRDKIISEMNTHSAITLVNSRQEEIGVLLYDNVYCTKDDKCTTIRFAFDNLPLEYFLKINFNNILMYDKNKKQLCIKMM